MKQTSTERWFWQLEGCWRRGMADFHAGRHECPYNGKGVNRQRRDHWQRGHDQEMQIASDQSIFDKARAGVPGYIGTGSA